jgi:hypothetical protein
MRPDKLILTTSGFYSEDLIDSSMREFVELDNETLLESWNVPVRIDEMVSLHNLFSVLRKMTPETRNSLELLTNSSLDLYLDEATKIYPTVPPADEPTIHAIELLKDINISNWDDLSKTSLEVDLFCNGIATDSTGQVKIDTATIPWYRLRSLPLILNKTAHVTISTWAQSVADSSDLSGRTHVKDMRFEWSIEFTLGEMFQALLNEIALFGNPKHRDELVNEQSQLSMNTESTNEYEN